MREGLLAYKQVQDLTAMSRVTIWRMVESGAFPKPIKINPKNVRFVKAEVLDWIDHQAAAR